MTEHKHLQKKIKRLEEIVRRIFIILGDRDNWESFHILTTELNVWADNFGLDI